MLIKLTRSNEDDFYSLEKAFRLRETKREFLKRSISLEHLSKLLHAAQGKRLNGNKLVAPSAQEQYPLSTYIVAKNMDEVAEGIYQYDNSAHTLKLKEKGQFSDALAEAAIGEQPWLANASAIIVLASNIQSMNQHFAEQKPFKQRGERYCYIEVGAVAQNVQLQGTALGIGMVLVGGFDNERVKAVLKLPSELEPSALLCLGNV